MSVSEEQESAGFSGQMLRGSGHVNVNGGCISLSHGVRDAIEKKFKDAGQFWIEMRVTQDGVSDDPLCKALTSVQSLKEYWNGGRESAVDAAENSINVAEDAEHWITQAIQTRITKQTLSDAWNSECTTTQKAENSITFKLFCKRLGL